MNCRYTFTIGLYFFNLFLGNTSHVLNAIGYAMIPNLLHVHEFRLFGGNNELTADVMLHTIIFGELHKLSSSVYAVNRFQRTGLVVNAGVNYTAVIACLMVGQMRLFFEQQNAQIRIGCLDFIKCGGAYYASANNYNVKCFFHGSNIVRAFPKRYKSVYVYDMKTTTKAQRAWAMYDWANSTYNLVIGTAIFPIFYSKVTSTAEDGAEGDSVMFFGAHLKNTEALSYALAFGMLLVCLLAPTIAGVADYLGRKKFFMKAACYVGAASCASLYFFDVHQLEMSMVSIVLACIGFWCSYALYNSFLPEVAEPREQDKLSAKGYSLGYIGSVLLLVLNLVMIMVLDINARWCFVTVGIWWAGFAQYTFRNLPETPTGKKFERGILANGFKELSGVWTSLTHSPALKRYLLSFFVFSMGVQTIMQMASLFGTKEIQRVDESGNVVMGLADGQLIGAVLIVQLIAIPGAIVFSWFSKRLGNLVTLIAALAVWAVICITAYRFVHTVVDFYIAASAIGFIMGGTQSLARSTYSKLLPQTKDTASFFSFYDVTEKVGLIIGLLSFGYIEGSFGSMRTSILALIVFFILGLLLLLRVPRKLQLAQNS